ncbi:hypothetical protein B484DRAFT_305746, partial [Ochromonadaceae sp. CCMP2298]
GESYAVLFVANYISNAIIHPTAKMDYGILNRLYPDGREVDSPFWGTRLPHLLLIPATLAASDKLFGSVFSRLGLISFAATPSLYLVNMYLYTVFGVGVFFAIEAALSPKLEGKRMQTLEDLVKPTLIGMNLQWHADAMYTQFGTARAGPLGILQNAFAVALVFVPVKGLGFGDMGEAGLKPHERKMNGL